MSEGLWLVAGSVSTLLLFWMLASWVRRRVQAPDPGRHVAAAAGGSGHHGAWDGRRRRHWGAGLRAGAIGIPASHNWMVACPPLRPGDGPGRGTGAGRSRSDRPGGSPAGQLVHANAAGNDSQISGQAALAAEMAKHGEIAAHERKIFITREMLERVAEKESIKDYDTVSRVE